jgi:predicted protein tyrosine phosphatase
MERPDIVARSLADAERDLQKLDPSDAVVSIGSPDTEAPDGFDADHPLHLRLQFDDVSSHDPGFGDRRIHPPQPNHVQKLLSASDEMLRADLIYCHCAAGVSRSTAAAFILRCDARPPGEEEAALEAVFEDRPMAAPNQLMVQYADAVLERGGDMIAALKEAKPRI